MPQPSEPVTCDVYGCGMPADLTTDGTETDTHTTVVPLETPDEDQPGRGKRTKLGRSAIPHVHVCNRHHNWAFSEDAKRFAEGKELHGDAARHAAIKTLYPQRVKLAAALAGK